MLRTDTTENRVGDYPWTSWPAHWALGSVA